jgi:hypothetical protein
MTEKYPPSAEGSPAMRRQPSMRYVGSRSLTKDDFIRESLKKMPADWRPDEMLVTAKHGEYELAFIPVLADGTLLNGEAMERSVYALRNAMWQKSEIDRIGAEWDKMMAEGNSG